MAKLIAVVMRAKQLPRKSRERRESAVMGEEWLDDGWR
jgi:hypothetical protein